MRRWVGRWQGYRAPTTTCLAMCPFEVLDLSLTSPSIKVSADRLSMLWTMTAIPTHKLLTWTVLFSTRRCACWSFYYRVPMSFSCKGTKSRDLGIPWNKGWAEVHRNLVLVGLTSLPRHCCKASLKSSGVRTSKMMGTRRDSASGSWMIN